MNREDINSIESEAGIIASLIHKPDLCFYSEYLLPNHFTDKDNRLMYLAITDLAKKGIKTIDAFNIIEVLTSSEATRKIADSLTIDKLNEFIDMSDILARNSTEEYKLLVDNVLDAAFRRDMLSRLKECEALCFGGGIKNIEKEIYKKIDDTISLYTSGCDDIPPYSDVADMMWAQIEERQGTGYAGIPFKFHALNDYVTIERGELFVVGASQKSGKSIFLLNCAVDLLKQGYSVMYIDSELSTRMFTGRLLSHLTGIKYRDLISGHYSEDDKQRIVDAKEWVKQQSFTHLYMPVFDKDTLYTAVNKVNHIKPIDVIVIDYFKSSGNSTDAFATYVELGNITDCVKNTLCGTLNIAAISAAQATATGKLADSAKIARNASTVAMLTRKTQEEYDEDGGEDGGNMKLTVVMNRNGAQHVDGEWINLDFKGDYILFEQAKAQHIRSEPY